MIFMKEILLFELICLKIHVCLLKVINKNEKSEFWIELLYKNNVAKFHQSEMLDANMQCFISSYKENKILYKLKKYFTFNDDILLLSLQRMLWNA